jgi:hypothetical protein
MHYGTVDLQHGTGVDGNLHLCIKGHYTRSGFFFTIEGPQINSLYFAHQCIITVYFSTLQVKKKYM